jgi:hypothetical protein
LQQALGDRSGCLYHRLDTPFPRRHLLLSLALNSFHRFGSEHGSFSFLLVNDLRFPLGFPPSATTARTTFLLFALFFLAALSTGLLPPTSFRLFSFRTFSRTNTLLALRQTECNKLHIISCERFQRFFGHLSRSFLTCSIDIKLGDHRKMECASRRRSRSSSRHIMLMVMNTTMAKRPK